MRNGKPGWLFLCNLCADEAAPENIHYRYTEAGFELMCERQGNLARDICLALPEETADLIQLIERRANSTAHIKDISNALYFMSSVIERLVKDIALQDFTAGWDAYVAILEKGAATYADIQARTGIKRVTSEVLCRQTGSKDAFGIRVIRSAKGVSFAEYLIKDRTAALRAAEPQSAHLVKQIEEVATKVFGAYLEAIIHIYAATYKNGSLEAKNLQLLLEFSGTHIKMSEAYCSQIKAERTATTSFAQ